jgi:hypothetical protein
MSETMKNLIDKKLFPYRAAHRLTADFMKKVKLARRGPFGE